MKNYSLVLSGTLILALGLAKITNGQEGNKVVITQTMQGNIYRPAQQDATAANIKSLKLPQGFTITKFAEGLGKPRMMAKSDNGTVYVTSRDSGTVTMLKDTDKDGKADLIKVVAMRENMHGIDIYKNKAYLITVNEVYTADIKDDDTFDSLKQIMTGLPDGGQHGNRTLAVGPDDMLYISVGSTCNACSETSKESATMIKASLDGTNREIFAKGLRNTIGFDWHPQTKAMYGFDHGIDWLGDDDQKEELNLLKEGADYGWPFVYADGKFEMHFDPKGMTHAEYAAKTTKPLMLYTAHAAPMDMRFYTGKQFPSDYQGDAIVTMHGSWNRKQPSGYKLVRVHFENGKPVKMEDFITGFVSKNNATQFARVCGLVEYQDGSLLVSDDANGVIYKVSYTGS